MKKHYATFKEYLKHEYKGPYVATDIIIRFNDRKKNGIVLIERKYFPHGLALPGGLAEYIALSENAIKEAREETGLDIILDDPQKPFCVFSDVDQDPREYIASVTYTASGKGILKPQENEDAKTAEIYTLDEVAQLIRKDVWAFPHHPKILSLYLNHRRHEENGK